MESISLQRRGELIEQTRDLLKLELRDNYKMDEDNLRSWRAGDLDSLQASYEAWRDAMAATTAEGKTFRRVRVISEPLSDYQKMAVHFSGVGVEAGEQLRWLPRRLVSAVALPGNDCFVLDGKLAMFNVLDGEDDRAEVQLSSDPKVVQFCQAAFDAAWAMAVPHSEYRPLGHALLP